MAKVLIGNFKGPKGDQGVKGDPGTAATIQVGTTQTVQPEENAEVTNSGTASAAVLNFKIPRGADGMTDLTAEYSDASEYTCQPTVNAPVVVKGLDGKTEQVETTGAQLFDASKIATKTQGGATVTNNGDGSFTISGSGNLTRNFLIEHNYDIENFKKIFKIGNIYLKGGINSGIYTEFQIYSTTKNLFLGNNGLINITDEIYNSVTKVSFIFYGENGSEIPNSIIKPMLYQSGDGTWEPYTGGSPAPSPDYPQVIKGVGGMGYFDGAWVQGNISSTGTVGTETTGITSANAIPCKQNDSISVTYEDSIDVIAVAFYNASGAYISTSTSGNSVDTFTATAPANAASFKVNLRVVSGSTITPNDAKYCTVAINGEYQTGVEVHGAQLFDASKLPSKTQGGATVTNNGDGSFTISGIGNLTSDFNSSYTVYNPYEFLKEGMVYTNGSGIVPKFYMFGINTSGDVVFTTEGGGNANITKEILKDLKAIRFTFYHNSGAITPTTFYPMAYQDGDGTWEPYHHTALTIPLTSPLYEGDKICYVKPGESYVNADDDTVVADRILYGAYRKNAMVALDGSEDENWRTNGYGNRYNFTLNNSNNKYTENAAECNFFKYNTNVYLDDNDEIGFIITNNVLYCRFGSKSDINSVSALKTWLKSNPLTVVYKLATPYFEPFVDQTPFYNLRSFNDLTYIYSDDPLNPALTVDVAKNQTGGYLLESYAQAQKNAIAEANSQSRLSAIEQQLVNQATAPTE